MSSPSNPNNPSNPSTKKIIQIDSDFFNLGNKKGKKVATGTRKVASVRKKKTPLKHNTIKRELIKRIQQLKQADAQTNKQATTTHSPSSNSLSRSGGATSSTLARTESSPARTDTNEFNDSVTYLNSLVKNNTNRPKQSKSPKSTNSSIRPNRLKRQNRARKSTSSSSAPRTMRNMGGGAHIAEQHVNIDLPPELVANLVPNPTPTPIPYRDTQNNGHGSRAPLSLNRSAPTSMSMIPMHVVAPPYSNLKTSTLKPTYRQWTRKNRPNHQSVQPVQPIQPVQPVQPIQPIQPIQPTTNIDISTPAISAPTTRHKNIDRMKRKLNMVTPSPIAVQTPSPPIPMVLQDVSLLGVGGTGPTGPTGPNRKKITKRTVNRKYTVGRSAKRKKVSVLVKNSQTRKRIVDENKTIRKTDILEVKKYLRTRGFIKSGSAAPNNVLREMYESAVTSGDINNTNGDIHLHNYLEDTEENE